VKAQVATLANDLAAAVFDKTECADCRFNSAQQRALFGEAVADGSCTNGACFAAKTDAHLEGVRTSLLDEVPMVIILRLDSCIEPIRLAAEGKFGVGAEQAKACRSCENYGCTVSGVVGSVGAVEKNLCFNAECHSTKVAANMKAMNDAAAAAQAEQAAAGGEATSGATKVKGAKAAKAGKAKATPKPSVGVPQKVKDYRVAAWRLMAAKEVFTNPDKALVVLATLGLSGNARHIDDGKLKEVLAALTKSQQLPVMHPMDSIASTVEGSGHLIVLRMVHAMAASAMKGIDERRLRSTMSFLRVKVDSHWKLCPELLDLMTKSEIEALAEEVGIAAALGEKDMKKVMAEKKPEAIKKLLSVPGFTYEGVVPQVMQYVEGGAPGAASEEEAADEAGDGKGGAGAAVQAGADPAEQGGSNEAHAEEQQVAAAA
jgi:ParB family chromosome partitioning protein